MRRAAIAFALAGGVLCPACTAIDDFGPFHVVSDGGGGAASPDLVSSPDLTVLPPHYTVRGGASGLGGGRSTGGTFALSGAIGLPQVRVVSSGGRFTVVPLVPGK